MTKINEDFSRALNEKVGDEVICKYNDMDGEETEITASDVMGFVIGYFDDDVAYDAVKDYIHDRYAKKPDHHERREIIIELAGWVRRNQDYRHLVSLIQHIEKKYR